MSLNIVEIPYSYFPDFNRGRPLYNASIYVGIVDTDPEQPANQKPVTLRQEDGTEIPASQPILTSPGGVPIYNGGAVTILVDGSYSIKVLDSQGNQEYYSPDVTNGVPITEETIKIYTDIVYKESNGNSAVDNMFSGNPLSNAIGDILSTGGTTWERVSDSPVITIENYRALGAVHVKDFGAVGDGVNDDTMSIQAASDALNTDNQFNRGGYLVFDPNATYKVTSTIIASRRINLVGQGATIVAFDCDAIQIKINPTVGGVRDTNFSFSVIQDLTILNDSATYSDYQCAKNQDYIGVHCVDQAFVKVTNCHFLYFNRAIFFDGCQQIFVKENKIERCWIGVKTYGTESAPNPTGPVTQTDGITISDNILDQCVYPIYVDAFGANQGPTRIQSNYMFAPTQALADDGFYMRVGIIAEACKGLVITGTVLDAYTVYNAYITDNNVNTFVPETVGIMIDGHTADAYLDEANIPLNPPKPEPLFGFCDGVVIEGNQLRTVGRGVWIKNGTGVTITGNDFQDLTEYCVSSFTTFNSGKIFSNAYPGLESISAELYEIPAGARLLVDEYIENTNDIRRDRSIVSDFQYNMILGYQSGGGAGDVTVTFPYELSSVPNIQITPEGDFGADTAYISHPISVTTTGFTAKRKVLNGVNPILQDSGFGFYWEAKSLVSF